MRYRFVLVVVLVSVVLSLAAAGSSSTIARTLPARPVVFQDWSQPNAKAALISVSTSGTRVGRMEGVLGAWSPNGKFLACITRKGLVLIDRARVQHVLAGSDPKRGVFPATLAWTPDSRRLSYVAYDKASGTYSVVERSVPANKVIWEHAFPTVFSARTR